MTTEIEQRFFECFGISNCNNCEHKEEDYFSIDCCYLCEKYPEITDSIYLELICELNCIMTPDLGEINTGRLKLTILQECMRALTDVDWENRVPSKEEFKNEVRKLFEEEK